MTANFNLPPDCTVADIDRAAAEPAVAGICIHCEEPIFEGENESDLEHICKDCAPRSCAYCPRGIAAEEPAQGDDPVCPACLAKGHTP